MMTSDDQMSSFVVWPHIAVSNMASGMGVRKDKERGEA